MIEIVSWISHPSEMDLGDIQWILERATQPGSKVLFVNDEDIVAAEAFLIAREQSQPLQPEQEGLDDHDDFGLDEVARAVVLYRGEGTPEEVAIAYVRATRE